MCSIVGYIGKVDRSKILSMLGPTTHRGPDDRGIYINGNIGLGSNRLSIIDLSSKGQMPMFDEEKSVCIVFNGEIYNFLEIKRQLQKYYKFRTGTDTEVIIYAYKKWGFDCLKRLNGMFSFVIFDLKKNLLFGARDRLGEKPLKYYLKEGIFAFASEIKGLLPILGHKPEVDEKAINDYLTLQFVPSPKTGFKNIYKLPPGHYFIYKNNNLNIRKYWQIDFSKKLDLSENEWMDLLEESIESAVKERMISDVPLGAFLSGGIDSGATVAFMARNSNRKIRTFSVGFSEQEYDETKYALQISKKYNTNHLQIRVDSKVFEDILINMSKYFDEPFADNSLIPTIFLSRFARKKIKVAISGDGGDENFAGYDRYNVVHFTKLLENFPQSWRKNVANPLSASMSSIYPNTFTTRLATYLNTFDKPFYEKYLYYRSFFNNEKYDLYSGDFKKKVGRQDTFKTHKRDYKSKLDLLDNSLFFDINSYLPEDLLFKMDISSMSQGLEVRAPLLDYKLMELTAKIPSELKIKFFRKKYIFKKMLSRKDILPANIINRPKKGFVAPIDKWFKGDLKDYVYQQINSKKFKDLEIFDSHKLNKYLENYYSSKIDYSNNIFSLVSLSSWINEYV